MREVTIPFAPTYTITEDGQIFNTTNKRKVVNFLSRRGIIEVKLYVNGIRKTRTMNRLLWQSFKGDVPDGCHVKLKEGMPLHVDNLYTVVFEAPESQRKRNKKRYDRIKQRSAEANTRDETDIPCSLKSNWLKKGWPSVNTDSINFMPW